METIDAAVIGAGVIGLAVARRLALAGRQVVILEAENAIGLHTSSRSSEVIHAGIYYAPGSWRARLCGPGKHALYRYCAERNVAHRRAGKLIVAADDDEARLLDGVRAKAETNGVADLKPLDRAAIAALEPAIRAHAALFSPSTGIIDSHGLMLALQGEAEDRGAALALKTPVLGGAVRDDGIVIETGGDHPASFLCRTVVNAAGHGAQKLAAVIKGVRQESIPPLHYARGNYFSLTGKNPFRHLIYPAPRPKSSGWLGVHVTLDMAGRARFGPDLEWIDRLDYRVAPERARPFYEAIRRYWPDLPAGALEPAYAGVRPKLAGPGEPERDFLIQSPRETGAPGLVSLFGIDSPGLTSCLAIADAVGRMLGLDPDPLVAG